MRVTWMNEPWSFKATLKSGKPIGNNATEMEKFADFASDELYRWMTEDAADLPPFCDDE